MRELFKRLFHSKPLAVQIFVASFFVNTLFLASPIFVIQILSRYIGYGFDGTLYTLTAGMMIALILWMAFIVLRNRMCAAISVEPDETLHNTVLVSLAKTKAMALDRIPQARIQEIMSAPQRVQAAYEPARVTAVLDLPFLLLFFLALLMLSPLLTLVTLLTVMTTILSSKLNMDQARKADNALREAMVQHRNGINAAVGGVDTVRSFSGAGFLHSLWKRQVETIIDLRERVQDKRNRSTVAVQGLNAFLRVAIYAVGAKLVVSGELTVGALIGASILSSKALQMSSGFMQSVQLFGKANDAMRTIGEFAALPKELESGTALKQYSGRLEFKDVAIAFPGATGPLFESLSVMVEPGTVVGIVGANGAGKTTLAKLVVGLLEPARGQILADGVELRQIASEWWRRQLIYLPQEPAFLNGSYKENITLLNLEISGERLNEIIRMAGLRNFLDASTKGLETMIEDGGRSLPMGIRKRLAMARALVGDGRIAVMDEPTDGLDVEGCEAVFHIMNHLAKKGVTLFVVSRDPNVMKGFGMVIDLNSKPIPKIGVVKRNPAAPEQGPVRAS